MYIYTYMYTHMCIYMCITIMHRFVVVACAYSWLRANGSHGYGNGEVHLAGLAFSPNVSAPQGSWAQDGNLVPEPGSDSSSPILCSNPSWPYSRLLFSRHRQRARSQPGASTVRVKT